MHYTQLSAVTEAGFSGFNGTTLGYAERGRRDRLSPVEAKQLYYELHYELDATIWEVILTSYLGRLDWKTMNPVVSEGGWILLLCAKHGLEGEPAVLILWGAVNIYPRCYRVVVVLNARIRAVAGHKTRA